MVSAEKDKPPAVRIELDFVGLSATAPVIDNFHPTIVILASDTENPTMVFPI